MKVNKKIAMLVAVMYFIQSCGDPTADLDGFIDKSDTTDFAALKNYSVNFRSRGTERGSSVYFINKYHLNCSPYAVDVNDTHKSIIGFRRILETPECEDDTLSKQQIEVVVNKFLEFDICVLQSDNEGNVYFNPHKQDSPYLLRKSPNSTPPNLDSYRHYKGNWYLRNY